MKKCVLDDIYDLSSLIYERALSGKLIYTALFYDEATALMRALLEYDDVSVQHIDISDERCDGYNKEYFVILDSDLSLSVENAWANKNEWHDAGYLYFEADELYIDGAASYAIVKRQGDPDCETYELSLENECVTFNNEDDDDGNDDDYVSDPEQSHRLVKSNSLDEFLDFLKYLFSDTDTEDVNIDDDIVQFINLRSPNDSNWHRKNCYYFALILKDRFPGGNIYYDVINSHFLYKYKNKYYDHTGVIKPNDYLVKWDAIDKCNSIQKERIMRNCVE